MKIKDEYFDRDDRFIFISTVFLMIITHGFAFANIMFSHDSLYFHVAAGPFKVDLGRWLFPIALLIRGFATPWLIGVLSTIYVAISVVLVVRLLKFDRIKGFCVAILFSTNIALISLFGTYIFDGDVDSMALLCAVLAVYAFNKLSGKKKYILSIIFLVLCQASYQAYICVSIGLFLILLIYKSAECKDMQDVNKVIRLGLLELLVIVIAALIYIVSIFVTVYFSGLQIGSGYNGPGNFAGGSVFEVIRSIPGAYFFWLKRVVKLTPFNTPVVLAATLILYILSGVAIIHQIKQREIFRGSLIIMIPAVILLPLGVDAIYLVSNGTMHQLMYFAYCLVLLLPFVFTDISGKTADVLSKRVCIFAVAAIAIIGINNIVYANGAYTYKKLVYDNTLLHAQKIWEDVNSLDGYIEGETPVVFVGDFTKSRIGYHSSLNDKYEDVLLGAFDTAITYDENIEQYYYAILGRDMVVDKNSQENEQVLKIKEMPAYPTSGYCELLGRKVIVKVSENE